MQRFGEKLRLLRLKRGLTMQKLAQELGYTSSGYISDLETGRHTPSLKVVMRVAQFFNVTPDQLLRDELDVDDAP